MQKLTTNEIKFINSYLANSGIIYADIRYEMTDHVATALEEMGGDFYENFRQYMLEHKKELLESNRQFAQQAKREAVNLVFNNFIRTRGLLLLAIMFNIGLLGTLYTNDQTVRYGYEISSTVLFIVCGVFYFRKKMASEKMVWSGTDKLLGTFMTVLYLLIAILKADRFIDTQPVLVLYYSALNCFIISVLVSYRQLTKKYNLQFNG